MKHGGVHQQQGGDVATVVTLVIGEVIHLKVAVQGGVQAVFPQVAAGFQHAVAQDVQVALDLVALQAGLGEQVHPDGPGVFVEAGQQQHLQRVAVAAFHGIAGLPLAGVLYAHAFAVVHHAARLVFGAFDVDGAESFVRLGIFPRRAVNPRFGTAVSVLVRRQHRVDVVGRNVVRRQFLWRRPDCLWLRPVGCRVNRGFFSDPPLQFVEGTQPHVLGASLALDDLFGGSLGLADGADVIVVADVTGLLVCHADGGGYDLLRRRNVERYQFRQLVFNALVVGAQGQQYLAQLLPAVFLAAGLQPFFRVGLGRYHDGADDVAHLFSRRGAHGAAHRLNHVNRALAGFQERHCAQRRGVGALAEDAYVQDAVGRCCRCVGQVALGLLAQQDVGGCVQVFQLVPGGLPARQVVVQVFLNPFPGGVGLEVLGHVPGLVHRVHEGDAGLNCYLFPCVIVLPGRVAHGEGEGQPPDVVIGGEGLPPFALGVFGEQVGGAVGFGVVDTDGDDAVVGQPAVVHGVNVAASVDFHAEDGFVVH